ncbi:hypothetical protein QYE76_043790 [Lolium multiflorum]|uniref:Uncharacterized protein n=1 Tax=Lolium multiflorum TaxID=4521 RepID=A0AAD8TJP0_LOLMU|nr:hypothetical protein QYE76_043790 [Lolium multiflorum]
MVSNNKGKGLSEEDIQDPEWRKMDESFEEEVKKMPTKREQQAVGSKQILVGSVNTRRSFSHNLQGPLPPAPSLNSFPALEEALRVTDEFCDQYRALRREVGILQEENNRLRRMLERFLAPIRVPGIIARRHSRLCGAENTERKELSGLKSAGKFLPEGEIDAIVTVIELDFIGIIITVISTTVTVISTAAPRHRCNI